MSNVNPAIHVEDPQLLGAPNIAGTGVDVVVTSPWGVTAAGAAYYDPQGADPGEAAALSTDGSHFVLDVIA